MNVQGVTAVPFTSFKFVNVKKKKKNTTKTYISIKITSINEQAKQKQYLTYGD